MEREAFRQRMQQYKQARENNPQLKYWDWKSTVQREPLDDVYEDARFIDQSEPRFELRKGQQYYASPNNLKLMKVLGKTVKVLGPIGEVVQNLFPSEEAEILEDARYKYENALKPKVYADGGEVKDNTYVAPVYKEQVFIPATGAQKIKNDYQYKYGSKSPYKGGELEIISPEFDILTGITTLKPIVTKAIRDRARMAVYNNVAPGSYKKSYIAGASKRHEVFNAVKDFLKPGKLEENPKWRKSFQDSSWWEDFGYGNDAKIAEEIREESWKRYLGIKHTPKYYVDNLDGTVSYNLKNIPLKHQQNFVDEVPRGGKVVTGDYIGTAGGNVSASSTIEDGYDLVTLEDVWDLQPIQDANRAAILPSKLRDKISHIEVQPDGYKKIVYNNWVPKWFKNFEVSDVIGKGPFTNKTTIKAVQLKNKDLFTKRILSDEEAANKLIQHDLDIFEPDMYNSVQEAKEAFQSIQNSKLKRLKSLSKEEYDRIKTEIIYKSQDQLLKEYGPYIRPRNKYADGGIIDEDPPQNTSERPITNFDPKGDPYNPTYGYNPGAGYVSNSDPLGSLYVEGALLNPVFKLAGNAVSNVARGLTKYSSKYVPEVRRTVQDKINSLFRREAEDKARTYKLYDDAIESRNRIIEDLYSNPAYMERARQIQNTYGDNYAKVYEDIINQYNTNYWNLPNPVIKQLDAKAKMQAKDAAVNRYITRRQPAGYDDFEYQINRNLTEIDYPTTRHELGHYVDFNLAKSSNPDYSNSMFAELKRDLSKQKNPLFPDKTDYYSKGTEQKSYMNTLREYMFKNGMINNIGDKVTSRQIKKAIRSLPKDMRSIEAAYLQFATPGQYTKWFNKIPLLGTYPIVNKQFQNYEEDKDKARKQR